MLIMFYLHQPGVPRLDLHFLFTVLWQLPAKDLLVIRRDYDTIIGKIRAGQAHTLSEGDTMYLGACRKGQKGDRLVAQHNSVTGAPRRARSLKASYMRTLLQEVKEHHSNGAYCNASILLAPRNSLFSPGELSAHSVDELLAERFAPYLGLTLTELVTGFMSLPLQPSPNISSWPTGLPGWARPQMSTGQRSSRSRD